jgi:capsular exopolysaccharide synthesis family protein
VDLADHLRVIGANWWRIVLITLLVGAGVFTYSSAQDEVFEAEILLNVAVKDIFTNVQLSEQQLQFRSGFYARVVKTEGTSASAIDLELDVSFPGTDPSRGKSYTVRDRYKLTPKSALRQISTTTTDLNGLILLTGRGNSRLEAKDITEAFSLALINGNRDQQLTLKDAESVEIEGQIRLLQERIDAELAKPEELRSQSLIDASQNQINSNNNALLLVQQRPVFDILPVGLGVAAVGDEPVAPRPVLYSIFASLFVMFLSAELFVLRRALSDRFGRTHDIESITSFTGLPVLAQIPRGRGPEIVEAFRTLRTNLMFLEGAGRPRTIALVSPNPGAGKSFAAMHLAESAVAVDASVVLVDADLRRPVLHQRLRIPREPGLSDALRGTPLSEVLHRVEGTPNLLVMPSGSPVSDTVGVLGGKAFRQILDALDSAELVVVDTPPGAVYADALAVSAQCDAALLILDARTTRRRAARQLIEGLERTGASLIGVVVNSAQLSRRDTYERA